MPYRENGMKKLFTIFALFGALSLAGLPAQAQDKPAEQPAATAPAAAMAAAPATAPAAVPAPKPNKGDTTWMSISTILVILMIVPGLALF
jgi:Amt family ammonium transporter